MTQQRQRRTRFSILSTTMVTALGFDQLTGIRILVDLDVTCLAHSLWSCCGSNACGCLRIENSDHVAQAVAVLSERLLAKKELSRVSGLILTSR